MWHDQTAHLVLLEKKTSCITTAVDGLSTIIFVWLAMFITTHIAQALLYFYSLLCN